ncbi:MAG: hypothetical protein DME69_14940 [Verrucomicrobia bacterium]|nr:MAG: hypothetical protein DME69_14940 [Verrucomicrobiota bacterium]
MSQTTEKRSRFSRFGGWVAELVLVFVGVYAAFWLSNYQQHQQDAERRDRILASIERTLREGLESGKINRANEEREAAEFRRALDAGEMPPLHPFVFITDYSYRAAQRRIGYPLGTEPHRALSKIKRRTDRAESRPGHFLLLRSGYQEIAKTVRDISRSSTSNCEIC